MKIVYTESAPQAIGPYSQGIISGNLLFCSGQIPLDPQTMQIVQGGIREQTQRVLENLKALVESAGGRLEKAVRCGIFLKNLADFSEVNTIYEGYFVGKPARTTIEVSGLPRGALIEIDCIVELG